jgi:hypothetical protein
VETEDRRDQGPIWAVVPLDGWSVLATGPMVHGFKPGRGDAFLRSIKIRNTPSFGWEVTPEIPSRNILRHVKNPLRYLRYGIGKILTHSSISPTCCQMSLLVGQPESSGGRVRGVPQPVSSSPWLSMLTYHPGMSNRPVGVCSSET